MISYNYKRRNKMMMLDKNQIISLLKVLPYRKNVSAWDRGVKRYAFELLEELPDDYYFVAENAQDLEDTLKELRKILLKGANTWIEYSETGCAYIYDYDIAKALCSPSEFISSNEGDKKPNKYETWLDVQGRALCQAWFLIKNVIRDFGHQYYK